MAGYNVGTIEAQLKGNLDDRDFKKFDAAVAKAKANTKALADSQGKAAAEMRRSGKSYADIAKKLGTTEKETKDLIRRNAELERQQKETTRSTKEQGKATGTTADSMKRGIRYAVGLAAAYMGIAEAKKAIETTLEYNKAVQGLNRNLGISIATSSRWATVAKARDIDNKALVMSFTTLSKQIEAAKRGEESALQVFQQLGVTQKDLTTGGKDFQSQILKIAEAFGEAEGGTQRQAVAQQLLGRGYQTILPLFTEGTKSLQEQLKWADEFGTVLSGKTSDGLGDVVTAQRRSQAAMLGLQLTFTTAAAPAVEYLNEQFQNFTKTLNDPKLTDEQKINRIGEQVERIINKVLGSLEKAGPQIAERGGRIGIAIAKGIATSFVKSNWLGKLAVGAWLIHAFGGWGALAKLGGRAGSRIAGGLGMAFLRVVAPYFAADVASQGLGSVLAAKTGGVVAASRRMGRKMGIGTGKGMLAGAASSISTVALLAFMFTDPGKEAYKFGYNIGENIRQGIVDAVKDVGPDWLGDALDKITKPSIGVQWVTGGGWTGGLVTGEGVRGYAAGGPVRDPRDTVPAMLAPGEFVVRKSAVDKVGIPFLQQLNKGGDIQKEGTGARDDFAKIWDGIGDDADEKTKDAEKKVTENFESLRKKTGKSGDRLRDKLADTWRAINRNVQRSSTTLAQNVEQGSRRSSRAVDDLARRASSSSQRITKAITGINPPVQSAYGVLASDANQAAEAFGSNKRVELGFAQGGFLSGAGLHDTVPVMAAPGEAFLNRHQQPAVDDALALSKAMGLGPYGSLDELFSGVTTPHYFAEGGKVSKPKLTGGPDVTRATGQGGIDMIRDAAVKWVGNLYPARVRKMLQEAVVEAGHGYDYEYGGGHGTLGVGPFDCSGYVSAILGAGNFISSPMTVAQGTGLYTLGAPGEGKYFTWGVRGSSGMNAHTMISIKDPKGRWRFFESGSGHGATEVGGWTGSWDQYRHIPEFARGGRVPTRAQRIIDRFGLEAFDPSSKHFVGWGFARGGFVQRFARGGKTSKGIWEGTSIDKSYPPTDGYSGYQMKPYLIKALAEWAGLPGVTMEQITQGESMGRPGVDIPDPPGRSRGLYGINDHYNPSYGAADMRNPILNTMAAGDLARAAGGPNANIWHGSGHVTSWNAHYDADPRKLWRIAKSLGAKGDGNGRGAKSGIGPTMVWLPAPATQNGGVAPGAGRWVTAEQAAKIKEARRRQRAAYRKRWRGRKRALREGRRQTREEFRLPRFRQGLRDMPRFTDAELAETLGFHDPMAGDLAAYQQSYDVLDRIDPRLDTLQSQLTGSSAMDFLLGGKTLRERYGLIDRINGQGRDRLSAMRSALRKQRQRSLKTGTLPSAGTRYGSAAPPRKASKKEIEAYFKDEIEKRTKAIKAATAARRKQIMNPVKDYRASRRQEFNKLSEKGEFFRDIIADTRGQIAATRSAQVSQGRAFFAQGGRVGVPARLATGGGDVFVTVVLDDPVLSALNPQIKTQVDQLGGRTQSRGRSAGGRKAMI